MITLRPYQSEIAKKCKHLLQVKGMCYLSMQVRTGKTHTAIAACNLLVGHKRGRVLFVTKKKAISSIEADIKTHGANLDIMVINYESVHKVILKDCDVVILDEAHSIKAYPKPSGRYKDIKLMLGLWPHVRVILMSGTPCPESYSDLYHQFAVSPHHNPFPDHANFYKWAKDYVNVKQLHLGHGTVNDYSDADRSKVMSVLDPYFITYTQEQAGFEQTVNEKVLTVEMKPSTYALCKQLKRDLVIEGENHNIVADTGVKLMQKLHQMHSGTIKFECGVRQVLDDSKAVFIKERFEGKKIAIFYKFIAELEMLKAQFPNWTADPMEFNERNDLIFLGQIQSSREGINLSSADCLIFFNIDFAAVSYFQAKDRLTSKDRTKENIVYWIFSDGGIEEQIYNSVMNKKDYTLSMFRQDFEIKSKKIEQLGLNL